VITDDQATRTPTGRGQEAGNTDEAAAAGGCRRIDPDAGFVFVTDPDGVPPDATPLDMPGVELSDRHSDCSSETILRRYHLDDRVLWHIAAIVHEVVDDDERHDAPEACGLDPALRGLSMIDTDTRTGPPFDGLAEFYRRATLLNRDPA